MEPYLTFNGNASEALAFYAKCLGGTVASMTFGETPMGEQTPADYKDKVMHATLEARGLKLMASDAPPGERVEGHTGFSLTVQAKDASEGEALFKSLSEGGKVKMAYAPTFWASGFGMLEDRFGVPWMVNCDL